MYIDAEGTFRPQRLLQIAERFYIFCLELIYCFAVLGINNEYSAAAGLD